METKQMYSYSKETLLAFASLPSCQTRPDGIDPVLWRDSINSDVVEGSMLIPVVPSARGLFRRDGDQGGHSKSPVDDIPEWRRPSGGGAILPSGSRRKPYEEEPVGNAFSSSYPPRPNGPWGENNGPTRPPHDRPGPNVPPGRWDRSGDRDRERGRPPHDWDGDEFGPGVTGEGGQRPWVERDGLLGSGNRPPPQGPPRQGRPTDNFQPPRPLMKTPLYGKREDTDIVNNETFGSLEASNVTRAEQERKRRESFEMMRKEQHRQLQEQKPPAKAEIAPINRKHDENSLWDNPFHQSPPHSPTDKTIVPSGPTTPRPAVPPGFTKVAQLRLGLNQAAPQQEEDAQGDDGQGRKRALGKDLRPSNTSEFDKTDDSSSVHSGDSVAEVKEVKYVTPSPKEMITDSDIVDTKLVLIEAGGSPVENCSPDLTGSLHGKMLDEASDLCGFSLEGTRDAELSSDICSLENVGHAKSESLLDRLFGNAAPGLIVDGVLPNDFLETKSTSAVPMEDNWSDSKAKTSRFAQWFHPEDEKFTSANETSGPTNIMSLFAKNDPSQRTFGNVPSLEEGLQGNGFGAFNKPGRIVLPMPVGPSLADVENGMTIFKDGPVSSDSKTMRSGISMASSAAKERPPPLPPVFMTCEDIEQSMLAEAVGSDEHIFISRAAPAVSVAEATPKDATSASQHLLALLQKRPARLETGLTSGTTETKSASEKMDRDWAWKKAEPSNNQTSEVHTLEALFGEAFMSKLQSSAETLIPGSTFSDDINTQKSELTTPSPPLFLGDKLQVDARSNKTDDPQKWFGSSGPKWNNTWPDSKDVESVAQHDVGEHYCSEPQQNHLLPPDPEDNFYGISSAPQISDFWGNRDTSQSHDHVSLDSMNGATASIGGPSFLRVLSEGLHDSDKAQNGGIVNSRASESEVISGELSPICSTNSRLLPTGDKLFLLTKTSEVDANEAVHIDSSKRLPASKFFLDPVGKVKESQVNGAVRSIGQGNGAYTKASAVSSGFSPFPVDMPPQQNFSAMFRPVSPPGLPIQQFGAPPLPRQHQRASHGNANPVFSNATLRPQPPTPVFNNNALEFGFDGSGSQAFAPPARRNFHPLPHTFHGPMAHQSPQFLGQPQILQRPPFFPGMSVQEHEGVKHQLPAGVGSLHAPPGHHVHGQHLPNQAPPMGFLAPFNSEFSRPGGKSHVGGYGGGGNVERWFGMDGIRSGLSGSLSIPQPLLGAEGDMNLRFG